MQVLPIKTKIFEINDLLLEFIKAHVPELQEGDVLVITSKIIALSEGRVGKIEDREKILRAESELIIETPWAYLTLTTRGWEINAGIDESNADNQLFYYLKILLLQLKLS